MYAHLGKLWACDSTALAIGEWSENYRTRLLQRRPRSSESPPSITLKLQNHTLFSFYSSGSEHNMKDLKYILFQICSRFFSVRCCVVFFCCAGWRACSVRAIQKCAQLVKQVSFVMKTPKNVELHFNQVINEPSTIYLFNISFRSENIRAINRQIISTFLKA